MPIIIYHEALLKRLRLNPESPLQQEFQRLLQEAEAVGCPQGAFLEAPVSHVTENSLAIAGTTFQGEMLVQAVGRMPWVYPFIATCGIELEAWGEHKEDPLQKFWASEIMAEALNQALVNVKTKIVEKFKPKATAMISPGAMADWPLGEQERLFTVLGKAPERIGVRLTEEFMMLPIKTLTGVIFPVDQDLSECVYCDRSNCPERKMQSNRTVEMDSHPSRCNGYNKRSG